MGQVYPAAVNRFHHSENIHSRGEAFPGVVDAGNRDGVNGQEGHHAAANVGESAEGLQVGDAGADDVAGSQAAYVPPPALLLSRPSGQKRRGFPRFLFEKALD